MQRIRTCSQLEEAVECTGILPFFKSCVAGWSLAESIDPAVWFTSEEGPWEWKGQLAAGRRCVYGKFIGGKAAFVSPDCFGELMNLRRGGLSFEERLDEGLIPFNDKRLMDYLLAHPNVLSRHAKRECGLVKGFDAALTRLQMGTDVILCDFRYSFDKTGKPYGWGNAALDLPERWFGAGFFTLPQERSPEASEDCLTRRILGALPGLDETALRRALRA